MHHLKVFSLEGQLVTDSRDVAEMIGKRHSDLIESIKGYGNHLTNGNIRSLDFFIPSTYEDNKNEIRPCYLLTRKGCNMVANKMTGEKGVLFTAAYVTKFEEMERYFHKQMLLSEREQLKASMRLFLETAEEVYVLKTEVEEIKGKVDNQITLDYAEQQLIQNLVSLKVYQYVLSKEHKKMLFSELYGEIKNRFGVSSYRDIKRNELQKAIKYIESWIPRKRNMS